jgi:hypothetical protein
MPRTETADPCGVAPHRRTPDLQIAAAENCILFGGRLNEWGMECDALRRCPKCAGPLRKLTVV